MNFDVLKNTLVSALNEAGLTEYEIYYMSDESTSVETLNKEVNSFASSISGGLCLRVAVDGKMGYASTELMTEAEMNELPARAKANAYATEKPDTVGIFADSECYANGTHTSLKKLIENTLFDDAEVFEFEDFDDFVEWLNYEV